MPHSEPLKIKVASSVLRGFRRRALRSYPLEHLETVWGRITADGIHIFAFHPIDHKPTRNTCEYTENTEADFEGQRDEDAPKWKLEVLGTIHSHPDCSDASPSEADWELSVESKETISGIYLINKAKNGRRQTAVRFYSGAVHETEITQC
jgi:proteasome lid subunit RPN8/RPN11